MSDPIGATPLLARVMFPAAVTRALPSIWTLAPFVVNGPVNWVACGVMIFEPVMVTSFADSTSPVDLTHTPPKPVLLTSAVRLMLAFADVVSTSAATMMSRGASRIIEPELVNAALMVRSLPPAAISVTFPVPTATVPLMATPPFTVNVPLPLPGVVVTDPFEVMLIVPRLSRNTSPADAVSPASTVMSVAAFPVMAAKLDAPPVNRIEAPIAIAFNVTGPCCAVVVAVFEVIEPVVAPPITNAPEKKWSRFAWVS